LLLLTICGSFLSLASVNGQEDLVNYTNGEMNFAFQHPSNWQVDTDSPAGMIRFMLPDRDLPIFVVSTRQIEPYVDTNTMTVQNTSLQQEVQKELDFLAYLEAQVIRQNATTVGESPGWKIEHAFGHVYTIKFITIGNEKFYTLNYQDEPLKVPERLPLISKVIESFEIIK
jgi:hypothetical protein